MDRFRYASAHGREPLALVEEVVAALAPLPAGATLGFVYATDRIAGQLAQVVERLREAAPGVDWVGTTGIGLCTRGQEIYDEPALAVMVTDLPRADYRLLPPVAAPEAIPAELRAWRDAQGFCFGLLHADPETGAVTDLIEAVAGGAAFINGGLTSSNTINYQVAGAVASGALAGVLFGPEVAIFTDHTQGCSPIGAKHLITEASRNVLVTLDQRPALDVMKEEIGEVLSRDLNKVGGYIFAALPIAGSDTGDYLVRNLLAIDTRQGLIAVGDQLEEGAPLMFCRRDGNSAREDLERMLHRLQNRLDGRPVRGAVYVSCLGRGRYQFGEHSEELRAISDALGDFPLVGFFANGEIYNGRLYGYTGVLTLFL